MILKELEMTPFYLLSSYQSLHLILSDYIQFISSNNFIPWLPKTKQLATLKKIGRMQFRNQRSRPVLQAPVRGKSLVPTLRLHVETFEHQVNQVTCF